MKAFCVVEDRTVIGNSLNANPPKVARTSNMVITWEGSPSGTHRLMFNGQSVARVLDANVNYPILKGSTDAQKIMFRQKE